MKITNIETICLSRIHEIENQWKTFNIKTLKADAAIIVISTDSDLVGIGEACAYGNPTFIKIWIDKISATSGRWIQQWSAVLDDQRT